MAASITSKAKTVLFYGQSDRLFPEDDRPRKKKLGRTTTAADERTHHDDKVSSILSLLEPLWNGSDRPQTVLIGGMDISLIRWLDSEWWRRSSPRPRLMVQNVRLPGLEDEVLDKYRYESNVDSRTRNGTMIDIDRCQSVDCTGIYARWAYLLMVGKYSPPLSDEHSSLFQKRLQESAPYPLNIFKELLV